MKCYEATEYKVVVKDRNYELTAKIYKPLIKWRWWWVEIEPCKLKYNNIFLKDIDDRFDCQYWFSSHDIMNFIPPLLPPLLSVDDLPDEVTYKHVADIITSAIKDAIKKIIERSYEPEIQTKRAKKEARKKEIGVSFVEI